MKLGMRPMQIIERDKLLKVNDWQLYMYFVYIYMIDLMILLTYLTYVIKIDANYNRNINVISNTIHL